MTYSSSSRFILQESCTHKKHFKGNYCRIKYEWTEMGKARKKDLKTPWADGFTAKPWAELGSNLCPIELCSLCWADVVEGACVPQDWRKAPQTWIDPGLELMQAVSPLSFCWVVLPQSSPDAFCPKDRTRDIDAISHVIQEAKRFIYISITDYLPLINRSLYRWEGNLLPRL